MRTWKLRSEQWFAASFVALGILGAACSAKEPGASGQAGTAGAANEAGATNQAGAANEAGSPTASSGTEATCDAYFDALVGCPRVISAVPPDTGKQPESEQTRARERYRTLCAERLELPGTGFTSKAIEQCLAAIDDEGCAAFATACAFKGTLPAGSACVRNEQCEDSDCFSVEASCGGGGGPVCGVCKPAPAVGPEVGEGEACGAGPGPGGAAGARCADGLVCNVVSGPFGVVGDAKCAPPGGEGADCYGSFACAAPLVCPTIQFDPATHTPKASACQAPVAEGDSCLVAADCEAGLVCPIGPSDGPPAASTCRKPGKEGAECFSDEECGADLACALTKVDLQAPPGALSGTCAPLTFVEPGKACDGQATRCRVGACVGTCPTVIADGEACSEPWQPGDGVCDTFSRCVDGACSPHVFPTCDAKPNLDPAALSCPAPFVVECPKAAPDEGEACATEAKPGQLIEVSSCAYDGGTTECACGPGQAGAFAWSCATCPETQPVEGDACPPASSPFAPKLQCNYGDSTCDCDPMTNQWACEAPQ